MSTDVEEYIDRDFDDEQASEPSDGFMDDIMKTLVEHFNCEIIYHFTYHAFPTSHPKMQWTLALENGKEPLVFKSWYKFEQYVKTTREAKG
jgi:hypothetical protein